VLRTEAMNRRGGSASAPPVDARLRVWYNSSLESKNYVVPGLIAVILHDHRGAVDLADHRARVGNGDHGADSLHAAAPGGDGAGQDAGLFRGGAGGRAIAVLVGVFVFEVPFRGSLPLLAVSTCVFLFGALFWGIFISAAARTQQKAYQMGILTSFLPAFLLSGFRVLHRDHAEGDPGDHARGPARYFVTILKGIFLKGVGLSVLWGELGFLALYALIVFLLATRKLNQKVA
jgi:ABC-2 type transport system permease protein